MKNKNSYDSLLKTVAKNIQNHRKMCKITQEGMIEHGFHCRHYQRIESGQYSMSFYTLYRLSKIFKTDISNFLTDQSNQKKKRV